MKVTYVQYAGLSLDVLKEIEEKHDEGYIEPELIIQIPNELFVRWNRNYNEAIEISKELEDIKRNT